MTTIFLDAKPAALTFPVDRCAVVVVDMQNDFGSNGGMFQLAGIDIAPIKKIVPNVAALIACARDAGMPVVYLKQQHSADLANAGAPRAPHYLKHQPLRIGDVVTAPDGSESRILIEDTWNTAVINDLAPEPGDIVIAKHRYSGFFQTELDKRLREKGIETLIFAGATTSICVESTVRDGMFLAGR